MIPTSRHWSRATRSTVAASTSSTPTDAAQRRSRSTTASATSTRRTRARPIFALIQPLLQCAIARWNPVAETWNTRFQGFMSDYDYVFSPSQKVNQLQISLVDIFAILNAIQMQPGAFGDTPPAASAGQVFFDDANVDDRILEVLGNCGIPSSRYVVFSGNVGLWETVYSPGEVALTPIQEAADGEFPGVSNVYPDRFGRLVFHGREAKFDPAGVIAGLGDPTVWDFHEWKAGDGAAVAGSPSDTAHIRQFSFNRGLGQIFNSALATPMFIADADIAGQLVQDGTSIGLFGIRSWQAQNLLTKLGLVSGNDAKTETQLFAQYRVDNYAAPRNRITNIAFRPERPGTSGAAANWLLLSKADISDSLTPTIASPGGGGFTGSESFYIEGVHETVTGRLRDGVDAGDEGYDNVTMTLDLSPRAYFDTNPFPTS